TNRAVDFVQPVRRLFHGRDPVVYFLSRAVGNIKQDLGGVGHTLDGCNHLVNRGGGFAHTGSLSLSALHHVLHVDAHLVHGAGNFINGGGSLQADLGRLVGGTGDLRGSVGDLRGCVPYIAHQVP